MITNQITYSVTQTNTDEQGFISRYLIEHVAEIPSRRKMTHDQARKALADIPNFADVVRIEATGRKN